MKTTGSKLRKAARWALVLLTGWTFSVAIRTSASGTWTALSKTLPVPLNVMLLLSDGTVLVQQYGGSNWFQLTPDSYGSYVNGTWKTNAPMHDTRNFFASALLRDGRLFVAGGEYGTGTGTAEIYDPRYNVWTYTTVPGATIKDASCKVLPNGDVMVGPPNYISTPIYQPGPNQWSVGPSAVASQSEASWVKLPDNSLLSVDPDTQNSERYIPSLNKWIADGPVANNLYLGLPGYVGEIGPGFLLPNGKAFYLGGTGHTGLYTPSGTTNAGSWVAGPEIPGGLACADAPAAMMVNGKVLCVVSAAPYVDGSGNVQYPQPISFCEYDPSANSFTPVPGPPAATNVQSFVCTLLDLPDGTVLFCNSSGQLYDYRPDGSALAAGTPVISSVTWGTGGALHLTGTGFNGISEGAAYGDDAQMDSNYPLVRFGDGAGSLFYGRSYNWSDTGVMTGGKMVSTEVMPPWSQLLTAGPYSFTVVANGISSLPVLLNAPTWVDYNYPGPFEFGSYVFPYNSLAEGLGSVAAGGTIAMKPGVSSEALSINQSVTIVSVTGDVTIGH
jgi:hypothetical protein